MYQFHFFDARGVVPTLDFFDCADDGAATRMGGEQLRLHPTCLGVDIFDGDRQVVRLLAPRARATAAAETAGGAPAPLFGADPVAAPG